MPFMDVWLIHEETTVKHLILLLSAAFLTSAAAHADVDERVGDFALLDHQGYFHHMAWYDNNDAIVLLSHVNDSQTTRQAAEAFGRLAESYANDPLVFMLINPLGESRDSVAADAAGLGLELPVLIDDAQLIAESLGIERAGEALVYNPRTFRVMYRGPADASLEQALAEVLAGETVSEPRIAVNAGERISYPVREQNLARQVSYSEEVAPIISRHCADCHREGAIGPFALDSYNMVRGWSPMIREVLMTKRMPPGQIDPHVGEFRNSYTLSVEEQQTVLHWIAQGAPRDGETDPLAELQWPDTDWSFGEPDLIVNVPAQTIPPTGVLDYITVEVPFEGLDRDRWVRASEYLAGDNRVLHHTLNSIIPPGEERSRGFLGGRSDPDQASIIAYVPGDASIHYPPNTGGLLRKGSRLALQLHYTTMGAEAVDESRIGIWFYDDDEVPEYRMSGSCACIFTPTWQTIPAYDPDFEQSESVTVRRDAYLYSFLPHMHFRGKRMRFHAYYPDGTDEELINIANYNYNWQMRYELKEPKLVPAGTRIVATGAFDNSEQNKANPDPARDVPWGIQSWDEMFFGAVSWRYVEQ